MAAEVFKMLTSSEFLSAIGGAAFGGIIAWAVNLTNLREARKQRFTQQREIDHQLAASLIFKIIKIHAFHHNTCSLLQQVKLRAAALDNAEPWQVYTRTLGLETPIHYSADEMSLLLRCGEADVVNRLMSTDDCYNLVVSLTKEINIERLKLEEAMPKDSFSGNLSSSRLSKEDFMKCRGYMLNINSMFDNMDEISSEQSEKMSNLVNAVNNLFLRKIDFKHDFSGRRA